MNGIRRKIIINNFRLIASIIIDIMHEMQMIPFLPIESTAGQRSVNNRIFNIMEKLSDIKTIFDITIEIYRNV